MFSYSLLPRIFVLCALWAGLSLFGGNAALAGEDARVFRIYVDADQTENTASGRSIEMGIRTALSHADLAPDGVRFEIVPLDHRANAKRSFRNIMQYLRDPEGLAVIGGMHSPPYLTYRDRINEDGALLLLPWSAAGPITRGEGPVNWIFRASVDDTKAGGFLVNEALGNGGCKTPSMLLLNSGWGRFNKKQITAALEEHGHASPPYFYFDSDISEEQVRIYVRDLSQTNTDCVLFVGNGRAGIRFIRAMAKLPEPIRVFSHWGITGGDLPTKTAHAEREYLDLMFLQTCLPFGKTDRPAVARAVEAARELFPGEFTTLERQPAPVGFAHAYDLGLILMSALRDVSLDGDIAEVRMRVRDQLEQLDGLIPGLLKTYETPFSAEGFDAHEALGSDDLCLARYDAEGHIQFVAANHGAVGQ